MQKDFLCMFQTLSIKYPEKLIGKQIATFRDAFFLTSIKVTYYG